ncbi:MAG: DNA polymerase Y family protein [Halioglobus sp.]
MSLWLCLRFEQLSLECLERREDQPVVVLSAQRVLRVNDCAAALGIRQGQRAATVRTLAGDEAVQLLERDVAAEARCLGQLSCWAYSVTPTLHPWRSDCLLLEVGGCLNLFRGLPGLLAEVQAGIGRRGHRARCALAATPRAAWLLSFADEATAMAHQHPLQARLSTLPLTLLDDFSDSVNSLRRAGLHTLGDVLALPPAALERRCGSAFTRFLQQTLGQREDLQASYQPPATFSDEYWFGYEVKTNAELLPAVQQLLQSLCLFLRNTQLRSSEITWRLIGIDSTLRDVRVRSASSHSHWQSWYQLSRIRFEQLELAGGVEGLALECSELRPGELENMDLFSSRHQREPMASLLDRLQPAWGCRLSSGWPAATNTCRSWPCVSAVARHRRLWLTVRPPHSARSG